MNHYRICTFAYSYLPNMYISAIEFSSLCSAPRPAGRVDRTRKRGDGDEGSSACGRTRVYERKPRRRGRRDEVGASHQLSLNVNTHPESRLRHVAPSRIPNTPLDGRRMRGTRARDRALIARRCLQGRPGAAAAPFRFRARPRACERSAARRGASDRARKGEKRGN